MLHVKERRRHPRTALTLPAVIRDRTGRILMKGRSADVAPGGIRIVGRGGSPIRDGQDVWVDLVVPTMRATGRPERHVKLRGEVRRVQVMGEWRSVIVVVFETDFTERLLDPLM